MLNSKAFVAVAIVLLAIVVSWFAFFAKEPAPDFTAYAAGPDRKAAFFEYFTPIVVDLNKEFVADRQQIESACDTGKTNQLDEFITKFRIEDDELEQESACTILLRRADIIPVSLAIAQAANESAWGTSRFAKQGNNFFGQWCFTKGCGIVPKSRDTNKSHEVADFRSPADSVKSYMLNLNTHDAYKPLRNIRQNLRKKGEVITGVALSYGLNKYSERGDEYGKELRDMISFNKLGSLDKLDANAQEDDAE